LTTFDLPDNHFDGVYANASLFHVPGQELPRVLLELHASLKPGGVLFCSNPRGHNEEGWSGGRYGAYHDLDTWRGYVSVADGNDPIPYVQNRSPILELCAHRVKFRINADIGERRDELTAAVRP
jgi:SAM-dependent methyltransferase